MKNHDDESVRLNPDVKFRPLADATIPPCGIASNRPGAAVATHRDHGGPESSKASRQPVWAGERAMLLQRACKRVDVLRGRGYSANKAARQVARRFRNRTYRSDRNKPVMISAETLDRIYWAWIKVDRDARAFELHYCAPATKVSEQLSFDVWTMALTHDVLSFGQLLRQVNSAAQPLPSRSTINRGISAKRRRAIRRVMRARNALQTAMRQAQRVLEVAK